MIVLSYSCNPEFMDEMKGKNAGVIVWLDYTKYGTLSNTDLNNTVALAQKAMSQMPEQSCCFAIAPLLASDRRSGFREEFRTVGRDGVP